MAARRRASFTGLAIVLRRESLLPWNEPAQSNDWHRTVLAKGWLTSEVTRRLVQAPSPRATVTATATAHVNVFWMALVMAKTSSDHLERTATHYTDHYP